MHREEIIAHTNLYLFLGHVDLVRNLASLNIVGLRLSCKEPLESTPLEFIGAFATLDGGSVCGGVESVVARAVVEHASAPPRRDRELVWLQGERERQAE